jgi:hypothetical protein
LTVERVRVLRYAAEIFRVVELLVACTALEQRGDGDRVEEGQIAAERLRVRRL